MAKNHFHFVPTKPKVFKVAAQSNDVPFFNRGVGRVLSGESGNYFVRSQEVQEFQSLENSSGTCCNNGVFLPASRNVSFAQPERDQPRNIKILDARMGMASNRR